MVNASERESGVNDRRRIRVFASSASRGLFVIALAVCSAVVCCAIPSLAQEAKQPNKRNTTIVRVVFDFNDGALKTYRIPWKDGESIDYYMQVAKQHARGVKLELRGRGDTAFLVAVDDLKNEGAGGKNWIYRVNGELGTKSFARQELSRGDRVLWKFGKYR